MNYSKTKKIGAVVIAIVFLGSILALPMSGAVNIKINKNAIVNQVDNNINQYDTIELPPTENLGIPQRYDTIYIPKEDVSLAGLQNDIGYNCDAGNNIVKSFPMYAGEPVNERIPGNGRTGELDPSSDDEADWYKFSVCEGQSMQASVSSGFEFEFSDHEGITVGQSHTATATDMHFIRIFNGNGDYTFTVTLANQNDADTSGDAGDSISSATSISEGSYSGYMDYNDWEDWYSFTANSGQGIFVTIEQADDREADFDIHLYNPSDELVCSAQYYGEDELEYPADASGTWKIKIDMFPGWDTTKWPDDYHLYGSGAYTLDLDVGGSAEAPTVPMPQPDITPVAQTFIVNNDPNSNKDEYGYLAAVPAANYLDGGERYLSPIVYQGVDDVPTWFTTVDETTQYLLDDWNTYLSRHSKTAAEYNIPSDPVQAAADIATDKWSSSDTVVLAVDGSGSTDEIINVVNDDATLSSSPSITTIQPGSLKDLGGLFASLTLIGKKWGAIHLIGKGDDFSGDTGLVNPRYEGVMDDWWPFPYDHNGEDKDTFYPITQPGIWWPYVTSIDGLDELRVIKYKGDRYNIPIDSSDCSIEVAISTDTPSNLIIYLIDPDGNVRRPMVPHYNGGDINPLHQWNGGHWEHDQDEFRRWKLEPHDDYSVEVHNAMAGTWTAIVVPFLDPETGEASFNGEYHIIANVRKYNSDRISAGLSAANAAVIASMKHVPLLYVTENSIPSETSDAITQLGASNIIFVNINDVSSANPGGEEYTTMQEVIDVIKADSHSENFITITSLGTGDGYFAPAAMMAAYHVSPVLNIGEASEAYNTLDAITAWREYAGDYYHGCRSVGHLPQISEPIELNNPPSIIELIIYYFTHKDDDGNRVVPPIGLDLKLQWFRTVHDGVYNMINGYGLDKPGKEAYMFVAPRDTDIRDPVTRAFVGNNSFAGHIPVETPAFSSDVICRDILYPAVIYANPGRDVITSQMMNFPDGYTWNANDGNGYPNYASRSNKESFSSQGRFYEGHCIWDNLLERYNTGASLSYYTGHGTGGSGISSQYKNIAEQFPLANPRYDHLKDFDWWDSWRGYSGYDNQQTKTCREPGTSGYNAQEPNLYDLIHFKWVDQLFDNLHSQMEFWSSCTTGEHWGPMVYLSHGSAVWYGCAGSAYGVQDDLHNSWMFHDVLVEGKGIGESQSKYQWLFNRDFTTCDPTTLYGRSTLFQLSEGGLTNVKVLFGDPTMTCYSPDWIEPTPVNP